MESSPELMEEQYFLSLETMDSYDRLARTLRDQLVTGECLELLNDLGEVIQARASCSDYIYRHPEERGTYMDERAPSPRPFGEGKEGAQIMTIKEELAIKPLHERGHQCQVYARQTIHHYLGP